MASRKITDLSALTSTSGDDLLVVVDMAGPTTYKMTISAFTNAIPSNTNFLANVTSAGVLTANVLTATGNVTFNTGNTYLTANNLVLKKSTTPANTTDVPGVVGSLWSDGSYLYYQSNTTNVRRVAISTW